ncbi:MAG: hypothetical protein ACW97X_06515 [Candidatus Hodarchaeales archaeon]|jgi:hypothetical protein
MSYRSGFPFKRLTKHRSADSNSELKAGILFVFTGFSSYILFFETLVILLNLDILQTQTLLGLEVTGIPEIDVLTPLIIISTAPYSYLFSNIFLFLLSLIPWFFSGFIIGLIFGPKYDRTIILSLPIFIGGIFLLFFFLLFSILGIGTIYPSFDIAFMLIMLFTLLLSLATSLLALTMPLILPAFIGYSIGRKYTFRPIPPRVFIAQPDRQDPNYTRCQFLTPQDTCSVSRGRRPVPLMPNTCDNKWNHATCGWYLKEIKTIKSRNLTIEGDYIDELW